MEKHTSAIKPESWLVTAGRASEPGAPLNVPLIPASNFIIGRGREYSRDDGTATWEALEDAAITFPLPDGALHSQEFKAHAKLEPAVWFGVVGISLMALTQAMIFSFVERIGVDRGFGMPAVHGVLLAIGLVNLFPALLAGLLEHQLAAHRAVVAGAVLQAVIALVITSSVAFPAYAVATSVFAFVMVFTHTFAFGLLARLDPSGRVVAATPAMLMIGAAIGPAVGGTLVKTSGYATLGMAALFIAALAVACFSRLRLTPPGLRPAPQ